MLVARNTSFNRGTVASKKANSADFSNSLVVVVVAVTASRSLPRDGGMEEDHESLEAGQLPMA